MRLAGLRRGGPEFGDGVAVLGLGGELADAASAAANVAATNAVIRLV